MKLIKKNIPTGCLILDGSKFIIIIIISSSSSSSNSSFEHNVYRIFSNSSIQET